jgi:hypothetical protein
MKEAWIYRDCTLTLPRRCVLTGETDRYGQQKILEQGYPAYFPSRDLYNSREDAIKARAVTIRKRIQQHEARITLLHGEISMLTDMLPEETE